MSDTLLQQLSQLDDELFAALQVNIEDFDDVILAERLQKRANLLQQVVSADEATEQQVKDVIERSKQLTSMTEAVKEKLGERLQTIQKGRRSQQAYQSVKHQE
ncbi:hypothetical protein [Oceanisphaera pacifica]|uniref:Flagellar protein FliT n=1 Tax=Oceanisphaera pacifica TaxID=2818389 RepID=A0ABS3NKB9_9GAMM|nr:hypothetical protein [Oceanisphaera pacifica]MBO1520740.1 hypothetical protein [Oceanisphaera pacifica]